MRQGRSNRNITSSSFHDGRSFNRCHATRAARSLRGRYQSGPPRSTQILPTVKPGTHTSFGPLKQIDAGLLNVGYAEAGPADGPAVILLHGWPYDIYSFVDVAPLLGGEGLPA